MATHNLQLKRNKNLFKTKEEAVNHLNSLVNKLEDGEIVLCRYFNNETIQTLIGFETKYEITNTETQEKQIINAIAYVDSFSEVGLGLLRDEKGVLQLNLGDGLQIKEGKVDVKINSTITNFLHVDEYGMKVNDMAANVTKTTEKILVMGGPLDTPTLRSVVDKDENGNACINIGTNIQTLLYKLLCKEIYPYNETTDVWYMEEEDKAGNQPKISYQNPSFTVSVKQPIINGFPTNKVEVGTIINFSATTETTTPQQTSSKVTNMKWGYASSYSDKPTIISATNIQNNWNYNINNDYYVLKTTVNEGFKKFSQANVTGTTNSLPFYQASIIVDDGTNKITWYNSGATYNASINAINSVYLASNLGNIKNNIKTKMISGKTSSDVVPTNNISKTVTGVRYVFAGVYIDNIPTTINSTEIRKLKSKKDSTNFEIEVADRTSQVIIAMPNTLTLKSVKDMGAFGTDIVGSFKKQNNETNIIKVQGANEYDAIEYNVYIYKPDARLGENTYEVTLE